MNQNCLPLKNERGQRYRVSCVSSPLRLSKERGFRKFGWLAGCGRLSAGFLGWGVGGFVCPIGGHVAAVETSTASTCSRTGLTTPLLRYNNQPNKRRPWPRGLPPNQSNWYPRSNLQDRNRTPFHVIHSAGQVCPDETAIIISYPFKLYAAHR